jgi:hypothetical protein
MLAGCRRGTRESALGALTVLMSGIRLVDRETVVSRATTGKELVA